jgi:hypothetical protein
MPDRVVPILEKIDKEGDGSSDGFSAFLVLQAWEVERRGRFNAKRVEWCAGDRELTLFLAAIVAATLTAEARSDLGEAAAPLVFARRARRADNGRGACNAFHFIQPILQKAAKHRRHNTYVGFSRLKVCESSS